MIDNEMMEDPVHPAPPSEGWKYPKFDSIVSTIGEHVSMDRSSMDPGNDTAVYILEEGFLPQDRSWIDGVRKERMKKRSKVLYRPEIVNDLVQRIDKTLAEDEGMGMLVKGPPGVGKSYSLINLTRYLLASGNYWVTIIPDCEMGKCRQFFQILAPICWGGRVPLSPHVSCNKRGGLPGPHCRH